MLEAEHSLTYMRYTRNVQQKSQKFKQKRTMRLLKKFSTENFIPNFENTINIIIPNTIHHNIYNNGQKMEGIR